MKARVKGGAIEQARVLTDRGHRSSMAHKVFNGANLTRNLRGGATTPVFVLNDNDSVASGGQYHLKGGPAQPMIVQPSGRIKGGVARAVYPVDTDGNYDYGFPRSDYQARVHSVERDSLIGFWPQDELAGAVSHDASPEQNDGAYTGVTLGQPGIGDGRTVPYFDGIGGFNHIGSAGLTADFNPVTGGLLTWVRAEDLAVWGDAAFRWAVSLQADDNNKVEIYKPDGVDRFHFRHRAGGVTRQGIVFTQSIHWMPLAITWDAAEVLFYADSQLMFDPAVPGVWAGGLNANLCNIGSFTNAPAFMWRGWIGPTILFSYTPTAEDVSYLSSHPQQPAVVLSFDDQNDSTYDTAFPLMEVRDIKGTAYIISSTVGGGGLMTVANLQTLDAAGWDMANHTDTHPDLTTLNQAQQEAELLACRTALEGWGLTRASRHVAYPGGTENANTHLAMAAQGMLTGRKVTPVLVNPWTIRPEYMPGWNITVLANIIAETQDALDKGQTFFYFGHDIGGGVDLSAADFETYLDWLITNNVETLTISELYARMPQ